MKYIKSYDNIEQINATKKFVNSTIYYNKEDDTLLYNNGFIPLEYIRSTADGGQYILLKKLYNTSPINFRLDTNFMIYGHGKTGAVQSTYFTAVDESQTNVWPGCNIRLYANNDMAVYSMTKEKQEQYDGSIYQDQNDRWYVYINAADGTNLTTYSTKSNCTNILIHYDYEINFSDNQLHEYPTVLFGALDENLEPTRFINARIDYLKLYKNNILIHDLIPVQQIQGEVGLFDRANGEFLTSLSDTPFVAGPTIY